MHTTREKSKIPRVLMYTGWKCHCLMSLFWRCSWFFCLWPGEPT